MRLALFHWPPLASHGACVILGILCQHVDPMHLRSITLSESSVIVALPDSVLSLLPDSGPRLGAFPSDTRVMVAEWSEGRLCRVSRGSTRLIQRKPAPAVALRWPEDAGVFADLTTTDRSAIRLVDETSARRLDTCKEAYQVRYGSVGSR